MQDSINNLKTNVDAINEDKTNNLKPENIRSGVTILGISGTLEEGIDTSDANATAEDIAINKTAYVNEEKVEGSIQVIENGYSKEIQLSETNNIPASNKFELTGTNKSNLILRNGAKVRIPISYNSVATAMKITSDKIKSGESIFGVEGNQSVVDTSDANVTSDDIISNKTAYVNGQKITGSMIEVISSSGKYLDLQDMYISFASKYLEVYGINNETTSIGIRPNGKTVVSVPFDDLSKKIGIKSDSIVEGKTILGVNGTAKIGTDTSDANATSDDIAQGKTAYVNGQKITGSLPKRSFAMDVTDPDSIHIEENSIAIIGKDTITDEPYIYEPIDNNASVVVYDSVLAQALNLTQDKIVEGNTILGIEGTATQGVDTSDATAAADDIIRNKTAYVNGEKVTGTILDSSGRLLDAAIQVSTKSLHHEQFDIEFSTSYAGGDRVIRDFDDIILGATNEQVANAINLTADKIATGNTILGIVGTAETLPENTYTIDTSASYSSDSINVTGTELQLTNIQDNNELWKQGAKYTIYAQLSDVASKLGITANKIVQGNTIAGVQGTASTILTEEFTKEQYAYMNGKTVVEYPDSLLLKSISMLDGSSITLTEAKLLSVVLLGDGITNESTKLDTVFTLAIKLNSSDLSKLSNKTFMLKAVFTPAEFDIGTININETSDIQYITVNTSIRLTSLLNEVDRYKIVEVDS